MKNQNAVEEKSHSRLVLDDEFLILRGFVE